MTQAAILCGGRGTRLGALTEATPKPLLEVGGVPFLDHVICHLRDHGVDRFLLLAGYRAMQVVEYARDADLRLRVPIYVAIEPEPAGTGGALWHARERLDETFIVANGDTLFEVDPRAMTGKLVATPALSGVVAKRPSGMGGGLYAMRREFLEDYLVPDYASGFCDLDVKITAAGRFVESRFAEMVFDDYFVDIGTPAELERARRELEHARNE